MTDLFFVTYDELILLTKAWKVHGSMQGCFLRGSHRTYKEGRLEKHRNIAQASMTCQKHPEDAQSPN